MWQTDKRKGRQERMVKTILIYLHLAVIFIVGGAFLQIDENKLLKWIGGLNVMLASILAYLYAVSQLWQVFRG